MCCSKFWKSRLCPITHYFRTSPVMTFLSSPKGRGIKKDWQSLVKWLSKPVRIAHLEIISGKRTECVFNFLLLRRSQTMKHCCGKHCCPKCFLGAQTRKQNVSEQIQKHFCFPGSKCCFRNKCFLGPQTGNLLLPRQCFRNILSSFAGAFSIVPEGIVQYLAANLH